MMNSLITQFQSLNYEINPVYITQNNIHKKVIKAYYVDKNGVYRQCYGSTDPIIKDFTYIDNGDGTYTLTSWLGTYKGQPSTELIIPDDDRIVLKYEG